LHGRVELDEVFIGGIEEGVRGRQTETKALVAVACEERGKGIGRIRLRRIPDASASSLEAFLSEAVEPGSVVHTDGWEGYSGLTTKGYRHRVTLAETPRLASLCLANIPSAVKITCRGALRGRNEIRVGAFGRC
jgi:transposase-like protein